MGYLEKEFILHERDDKGKFLPLDFPIKELGNKLVRIIPLSRGEILKVASDIRYIRQTVKEDEQTKKMADVWENLVIDHITDPKFTKEDLSNAKMIITKEPIIRYRDLVDILVDAIYLASGLETPEKVDEAEEDLKKK